MIIEKNKRLAESLLWQLQGAAYELFGPRAWSEKGVPCYLTSNPMIAKYYAHIALGFLQDCAAAGALDWELPVYCFDLGAGTGRLAYLFLKEFLPILRATPFGNKLTFCYIMTDISEENRSFWLNHPQLAPYFRAGLLESAAYKHDTKKREFYLEYSKKEIDLAALANPCLLIANYFFDTIPQDLFKIHHGKLYEGRVTLEATEDKEKENEKALEISCEQLDPEIIATLKATWDYSLLTPEQTRDYYTNCKGAQGLLDYYLKTYEELTILLPFGACQTVDFFRECSRNRLLLLASDQGVVTEEQLRNWGDPTLSLHGSFSLPVSYHGLAHYFLQAQGTPFLTALPDPLFVTIAAALDTKVADFPMTNMAFNALLNAFEPKDYWRLVEEGMKRSMPTLEEILIWIKLGNWDPTNFHTFFGAICSALPQASQAQCTALLHTLERVYDNFFWIEASNAIFLTNLGVLCYYMKNYKRALFFFEQSRQLSKSEDPMVIRHIAACVTAQPPR